MKSKKLVVLENVNPYPFEILHLSPYNISKIPSIGKLGSWAVLEVFRIEALRRCKAVHRLFQKKVPEGKCVFGAELIPVFVFVPLFE